MGYEENPSEVTGVPQMRLRGKPSRGNEGTSHRVEK